uniref:Putative head-tail joining protein n=1 Tax=viral metagenome TaxID=1070528 RepID=A0A6H1ZRT4_9ZZZZ
MGISAGLFNETFTPQTLTETDDGQGGVTQAWADGTAFRGRLSSLPVDERMSADKLTTYASHKLFCDNQTINETYRIRNSDSSRHFEIKGIVNPSNASHHLELTLLELD